VERNKDPKEEEIESLRNILQRTRWASSFQAFQNLPGILSPGTSRMSSPMEEVKVSFPAREGLERFLSAAFPGTIPCRKLSRIEDLRTFFDHAERVLFVHQYLSDQRLSIPENMSYNSLRRR